MKSGGSRKFSLNITDPRRWNRGSSESLQGYTHSAANVGNVHSLKPRSANLRENAILAITRK
jgi:hypothetical protein